MLLMLFSWRSFAIVHVVDPAIAATLIGIMVAALLGVFAGAFHLLRSGLKELRTEVRSDLKDLRADNRDTNERIDRLEGKVDSLILALARAGFLVDPQSPQPPAEPQG